MKIEFLAAGGHPAPLIRRFQYRPEEIQRLWAACQDLAAGSFDQFAQHEQMWIQPINGCRFFWRATSVALGVPLPANGHALVLLGSPEAWHEIGEKLLQFIDEVPNTFTWLSMDGDVRGLLSMDGCW